MMCTWGAREACCRMQDLALADEASVATVMTHGTEALARISSLADAVESCAVGAPSSSSEAPPECGNRSDDTDGCHTHVPAVDAEPFTPTPRAPLALPRESMNGRTNGAPAKAHLLVAAMHVMLAVCEATSTGDAHAAAPLFEDWRTLNPYSLPADPADVPAGSDSADCVDGWMPVPCAEPTWSTATAQRQCGAAHDSSAPSGSSALMHAADDADGTPSSGISSPPSNCLSVCDAASDGANVHVMNARTHDEEVQTDEDPMLHAGSDEDQLFRVLDRDDPGDGQSESMYLSWNDMEQPDLPPAVPGGSVAGADAGAATSPAGTRAEGHKTTPLDSHTGAAFARGNGSGFEKLGVLASDDPLMETEVAGCDPYLSLCSHGGEPGGCECFPSEYAGAGCMPLDGFDQQWFDDVGSWMDMSTQEAEVGATEREWRGDEDVRRVSMSLATVECVDAGMGELLRLMQAVVALPAAEQLRQGLQAAMQMLETTKAALNAPGCVPRRYSSARFGTTSQTRRPSTQPCMHAASGLCSI